MLDGIVFKYVGSTEYYLKITLKNVLKNIFVDMPMFA